MKIILDCDTGIDDAVAIAYALASPEAEVLGIGSVFGNVETPLATENTLKVLAAAGRPELPVAEGAHRPLLRAAEYAKFVHGEDGLGNTNKPPSGLAKTGEHAADQIIRLAREHPGEVVLVPVGRLTNLALAVLKDPELPGLVREVVLMGGAAAEAGNVGSVAEANIHGDPEAAQVVFETPWKLTVAPLDITMHTLLLDEHMERLREGGPLARWVAEVVEFYFEFYSQSLGRRACAMHDAVAVGLALGQIEPRVAHTLPVSVVTQDGPALGQTVIDRRPLTMPGSFGAEGAHADVVMEIDGAAFVEHLVGRLEAYEPGARGVA